MNKENNLSILQKESTIYWKVFYPSRTNINDDGTVPQYEEKSWLGNNSFRQNSIEQPSACVDLTASYIRISGSKCPDTTQVTVRIGNAGLLHVSPGVPVSCYFNSNGEQSGYAATLYTSEQIVPGAYEDVVFSLSFPVLETNEISVVADVAADGTGVLRESNEDNNLVAITAEICNSAPVIVSIPSLSATEGLEYQYGINADDSDGDTLRYILAAGPKGMSIDSVSGAISWTPKASQGGTVRVRGVVHDGKGGFDDQEFTLNVADIYNLPPEIISHPLVEGAEGENYRYVVTANDADNDPLHFVLSNAPEGMVVDENSGLIEWVPSSTQAGSHSIEIDVDDGRDGNVTQEYNLYIAENVNTAPVILSTPNQSVDEGAVYQYPIAVFDADGDICTFTLLQAPEGMEIDETGVCSWVINQNAAGQYPIQITVNDARGGTTVQNFTLTVVDAINEPPQITSTPLTIVDIGETYSYSISASDPDGDNLLFSLSEHPEGMNVNDDLVAWNPISSQEGQHTVEIEVIDGRGGSANQTFTLLARNPENHSPEIISSPVLTVDEGDLYEYQITVSDIDGDDIAMTLQNAPEGMIIGASSLLITWEPDASAAGIYSIVIVADDQKGGEASQEYLLTVNEAVNCAPVFTSTPQLSAIATIPYQYSIQAEDADGDATDFTLQVAPEGLEIINDTVKWIPTNENIGDHEISIQCNDGRGGVTEQYFTLAVGEFGSDNGSPEFTTEPDTIVNEGVLFTYLPVLTDPDGDAVSLEITEGPETMDFDYVTGEIQWPTTAIDAGLHPVILTASDGRGGIVTSEFNITVKEFINNDPVIVSTPRTEISEDEEYRYLVLTEDGDNDSTDCLLNQAPSGMIIKDKLITWQPDADQSGEWTIRIIAEDGRGGAAIQEFTITVDDILTGPGVSLTYSPAFPEVGDEITIQAIVEDDGIIEVDRLWVTVNNEVIELDNQLQASYTPLKQGDVEVVLSAYDEAGVNSLETVTIPVQWQGTDNSAPTVALIDEHDQTFFRPYQIIGTADDQNFAYYTLACRKTNCNEYVNYHIGTVAVVDGVLGTIDPTILENANYVLRIQVFDKAGNSSSSELRFGVDGQMKLGIFSIAFTDMSIPLPGFNMAVNRVYDSRDKTRGDFGYGWKLNEKKVQISENVVQGQNWVVQRQSVAFPSYYIGPLSSHTIRVNIPGGRTQVFEVEANLYSAFDPSIGYITYIPQPGTYGSLEQIDAGDFYVTGQTLYDAAEWGGDGYDPDNYKLTFPDNTIYYIDQNAGGVVRVVDPNGNTITFTDDAISHSQGASLNITRNDKGFITAITDIDGRTTQYSYDSFDNLRSVTDPVGNVTRYIYAPNHYLTEIIDPRGIRATRTEYDDDGRMVRQISPAGDTMVFNHDIDNQREVTEDFNGNETEYTYDDHGNVLSKTDAANATWEYTYDELDNVVETRNPDGSTRSSTWDARGNEVTTTGENNYTTSRTYNNSGQVLTETDPLSRETRYEYDQRGNLLRTIGPDGAVTSEKTYASNGNVLTEKDALGNLTSYTYDSKGRMVARIDPLGRETEYILDTRGNTTAEINSDGDTTKHFYDDNDNQIVTVNAYSDTSRSTYNVFNKVASQTDALGNVTAFEYDLFGQLRKTIAPDSSFTRRSYNAQGNVLTTTDETDRTTTFDYDHENRVIKTTFNDGSFTEVEYDERGRRTASIDRNGNRTEYEYDAVGNNTVVRDALGNETVYEYDEVNRRVAMIDALNQRTEYTYDDYDRLIQTTYHDGSYSTIEYDDAGRKTAEVDQEGKRTEFTCDSTGNLKTVKDAMLEVTEYTYNNSNNRISQTDANNHTTTMGYDKLNRLTAREYSNGDRETFEYDANGNMVSKVDGEGDSTVYTYDSRNREILRRYTNSGHTVRTVYTVDSKRDSVIDYRGITTYEWGDCCGQLVRVDNPDGTYLQYEYDDNKNKTASISPWSRTEYRYDPLNRMDSVVADNGEVTEYFYNAVGNRDSIAHANGTGVKYIYDNLNRLISVINFAVDETVLSSYNYGLNNAGIRIAVTEADGSRVDYGYDDNYWLTSETRTGTGPYTITYTYDDAGNRITKDHDGVLTAYTYNNRDQLESESNVNGSIAYTYDRDGRMVTKTDGSGVTSYSWQDEDRMAAVTTASGTINYTYDTDNAQVAVDDGTAVKNYLIDTRQQYAQVVAEYENTSAPTVEYVFGLERIAQNRGGGVSTYLADGQGSIRQLTSVSGNVTDSYSYFAFGEELSSSGSTVNEFRYVGEQFDPNAGFYYNRARWYNPGIGRFTSVDPYDGFAMIPASLHKYLYANNNPIFYLDPSGESILTMQNLYVAMGITAILSSVHTIAMQTSPICRYYQRALFSTLFYPIDAALRNASIAASLGDITLLSDQAKQAEKHIKKAIEQAEEHLGAVKSTPPDPNWNKDKLKHFKKHLNNIRKYAERLGTKAKEEALKHSDDLAAKAQELANKLNIDITF